MSGNNITSTGDSIGYQRSDQSGAHGTAQHRPNPSLQLHELEGRIHVYEGLLTRKIHSKTKLKTWKKRWFRIGPDNHRQHIYHMSQSKSTQKNRTDLEKRIITISKASPDLRVECISTDPNSKDFTGFCIFAKSGELLGSFRADDIVQQRNFMAALGGRGPGLFTQSADDNLEENMFDLDDVDSLSPVECDLYKRHMSYDSQSSSSSRKNRRFTNIPSYNVMMTHFPQEFYFPEVIAKERNEFLGEPLPIYDPSSPHTSPLSLSILRCRQLTDSFLPPHGPPMYHPVSLGYGAEAGLEAHQQAVWDPENDFYFFIDHLKQMTFVEDPRPIEVPKSVVTRKEYLYGGSRRLNEVPFEISRDSAITQYTAQRAAQKSHGFIINGAGSHGRPGTNGQNGKDGRNGENGRVGISNDGGCGEDGSNGMQGEDAKAGGAAGSGSDFIIDLSGNASKLRMCVNNNCSTIARLGGESCEEVVFVDSRGGNGGEGGVGGDGGKGGHGGDGGKGGDRGDGGHGGDGGMGGLGGEGGNGGNSGSGGNCIIKSTDPHLLMLVEVDNCAGTSGKGGAGGCGGDEGRRGFGAEGGTWEEYDLLSTSQSHEAVKTVNGRKGKPGSTGATGANGEQGSDGLAAKDGGLLWVVSSASSGKVLHQANTRYEAEVTSLKVTPGVNNNVYEPNQRITVSEVTIVNSGGLPLPAGAQLSFPTTTTVRFESKTFVLPSLLPNESFQVSETFHGRIFDQATPNTPGPLATQAIFSPMVQLLGRPFERSFLQQSLPVKYPVRLSFALSKKSVSRGEIGTFEVGIENVSDHSYGSYEGSKGSLVIRLHMDTRLIPLGIFDGVSSVEEDHMLDKLPYQVTYDATIPDSMHVKIKEIKPGEEMVVPIAFQMDTTAELCDICFWQADIYLKGKLIEYMSQEIRISPAYSPPSSPSQLGDILMITSDKITREEFAFWQRIFQILGVNVDYWDSNYRKDSNRQHHFEFDFGGILEAEDGTPVPEPAEGEQLDEAQQPCLPSFYHLYSGKAIVFPHCNLDMVPPEQIISHFHKRKNITSNDTPSEPIVDVGSSMLLFQSSTFPKSLEDHTYQHSCDTQLLHHLCSTQERVKIPMDSHSGYHLLAPGTLLSSETTIKRSEKKTLKKLEKASSSQALVLMSHNNAIHHEALLKYSYGSMDIRKCPILRSANFQFVDGAGGSMTSMGTDDPLLTINTREFPLASKFGQTFLAVLGSIPFQCKLSLLKRRDVKDSPNYVKFHLPNGMKLKIQQLAAISIAGDVADQILDCTDISRMTAVIEDLDSHKSTYSNNGLAVTINQMLDLIKREVAERKRIFNNPAIIQSSKEIQRLCDSSVMTPLKRFDSFGNVCISPLRRNSSSSSFVSAGQPFPSLQRNSSSSSFVSAGQPFPSLQRNSSSASFVSVVSQFSPPPHVQRSSSIGLLNSVGQTAPLLQRNSSSTTLLNFVGQTSLMVRGNSVQVAELPSMKFLQDSSHVLRSHQHFVDKDLYNVSQSSV